MAIKNDISYGVIPIRHADDGWEVFLINQYSKIGNNTYWVLPKGHPEKDETPDETAKRELLEETGMVAEEFFTEPTFNLHYSFNHGRDKIEKTVMFYIGIITDFSTIKLHSAEVKEGGWYQLEAAMDQLDYRDTKELFAKARVYIEENLKPPVDVSL